jgi:hypothetical protein
VVAQNAGANPGSKIVAYLAILAGVLVVVLSIFADSIGLSGGGEGVGWKQLIGAIVGCVLALLGVAWLLRPSGFLREE